jgi:F420-dependent oxidoreductase-like protein
MKIGLQITRFNWEGVSPDQIAPTFARIASAADMLGFDSLWVMDHFFQMELPARNYSAEQPMMESYTLLSYLAGLTQRATLGALVTGVHYRQPGHLVKIVSNLDVLSGGRAILGIGAGWYERESRGLGFPFPPVGERFGRLEETLQIALKMWSGDATPFEGKYYTLAEPMNNPPAQRKPHPPILIGGLGEKKTLRLVAQYADACNIFGYGGSEFVHQKLDVIKRHCDDVKRDYNTIERTTLNSVAIGMGTTPAQMIEICEAQASVGVQHAIFNMPNDFTITPLEIVAREVIPEVRDIQTHATPPK